MAREEKAAIVTATDNNQTIQVPCAVTRVVGVAPSQTNRLLNSNILTVVREAAGTHIQINRLTRAATDTDSGIRTLVALAALAATAQAVAISREDLITNRVQAARAATIVAIEPTKKAAAVATADKINSKEDPTATINTTNRTNSTNHVHLMIVIRAILTHTVKRSCPVSHSIIRSLRKLSRRHRSLVVQL